MFLKYPKYPRISKIQFSHTDSVNCFVQTANFTFLLFIDIIYNDNSLQNLLLLKTINKTSDISVVSIYPPRLHSLTPKGTRATG
jgi:hypothetical protein